MSLDQSKQWMSARNTDQFNQVSDTASMNSITTTNDSFNWRGTPDSHHQQQHHPHNNDDDDKYSSNRLVGDDDSNYSMPHGHPDHKSSKLSSHLLDSYSRDIEDQGNLNSGYIRDSGNMDYIQDDPYSSQRLPPHHDPYYSGGGGGYQDNHYGGNTSFERHSEQSYQSDNRLPTNSYNDLPNGGALHHSSNMHHPSQDYPKQQHNRSFSPQHDDDNYYYPSASSLHGLGGVEDEGRGGDGDGIVGYGERAFPYDHRHNAHSYDEDDRYNSEDRSHGQIYDDRELYDENPPPPHQHYGEEDPPPKPPLSGSNNYLERDGDNYQGDDAHSPYPSNQAYRPTESPSQQYPTDLHGEREDSYAGSYQGDQPQGSGNYMDPYPQPNNYNVNPDHGYDDDIYNQGGGHPSSNYSYHSDLQATENPIYNRDPGYSDEPQYHDDQFPQAEDYREIQNQSSGAIDDPYLQNSVNSYQQQQQQQNSSFQDPYPQNDNYNPYREDDRYSDVPGSSHNLDNTGNYSRDQQDHPNDSFHHNTSSTAIHHPDDPHQRQYEGLPVVRQDPFADDPFHYQGSGGQLMPDQYNRGPSPDGENGPYSRQSFNEPQAPSYGDQDRRTPYDDRDPQYTNQGQPYDDRGNMYDDHPEDSPYNDQSGHHPPYHPADMTDSYGPSQTQGYPDYPDNGSIYSSNQPHDLGPPYDPNGQPQEELIQSMNQMNLHAPPPMEGRITPADDPAPSYFDSLHPDLQQVIDFLSSPDDNVVSSAVAYLQHLTYNDDDIKAKTRAMGGIPALVALLSNDKVPIHKFACGALQNLSYGRNNIDNKRAIKNENGIPELIRLLRKTTVEDVMESVSGVLWNLSSCEDLKMAIIEDGLVVMVNVMTARYATFGKEVNPWSPVCRNITGIIRNVSSAGFDARKHLRECKNLVNTLIYILKKCVELHLRNRRPDESQRPSDNKYLGNKSVENTVCILRNLSYRIQEVVEPDFYKRRTLPRQMSQTGAKKNDKGEVGCFGNKSRSKQNRNTLPKVTSSSPPILPPLSIEYRGLWGAEIHWIYSNLLLGCTNDITMEAAAGAVQNLTACDWQPATESRMMMRKEKGLPLMVDLLSSESDRVVCATATALRNLAIDEKNKALIGKYAIRQLASRLPRDDHNNLPDDTICALVATLYEVVKGNQDFAMLLLKEYGLQPLMHINNSDRRYLARTLKFTLTLLKTLWTHKSLHSEYAKLKYYEADFTTSRAQARQEGSRPPMAQQHSMSSNHTTPYNTLSRPISGQGYDDSTLSSSKAHHMHHQPQMSQHQPPAYQSSQHNPHSQGSYYSTNPRLTPTPADHYRDLNRSNASIHDQRDDGNYSRGRGPPEEIHMNDFGGGYAPLDEPQPHRTKPPVGGVPLFPTLSPGESSSPYPGETHGGNEPLYAQVNKGSRRRLDMYGNPSHEGGSSPRTGHMGKEDGGVDSWV